MITIPTPPRVIAGRFRWGVALWLNTRTLDFSLSSGPRTSMRGPSYQEEARHRSLVERGHDGVDLGADLDFIDEARGQLRSECRRAGLGTE